MPTGCCSCTEQSTQMTSDDKHK